jgi:hypothetical protein
MFADDRKPNKYEVKQVDYRLLYHDTVQQVHRLHWVQLITYNIMENNV